MRTRVNRMPFPRFSVTSTPFGRTALTWTSLWSPMTTSTPSSWSAMSMSAPVGSVTVPAFAPSWPSATITLMPFFRSRSVSACIVSTALTTWNGPRLPGKTRLGVASVVKPTTPTFSFSNENTCDGSHSAGVCPFGKTTLADRTGKLASGISSFRRNCSPRSNWWFPIASASIPIMFMISTEGLSWKKFEVGGVAPPNESPPLTRMTSPAASASNCSYQVSMKAAPPMENVGFRAPAVETLSAVSASGANWACQSLMLRIVISLSFFSARTL